MDYATGLDVLIAEQPELLKGQRLTVLLLQSLAQHDSVDGNKSQIAEEQCLGPDGG